MTHPEYYEEMGIKPPKGVILYGPPGTFHIWQLLNPNLSSSMQIRKNINESFFYKQVQGKHYLQKL